MKFDRPKGKKDYNAPAEPIKDEKPHPLLKVPGTGNARWDRRIGRWVVGRLSYE